MRYYSSSAAQTALTGAITGSATTIAVDSVSGFPIQYPYTLSIDAGNVNKEIVEVTAAVGLSLTVTRAQDGTAGTAHALGSVVSHDHSARDFRESRDHEAATVAHGATGAVVGTDNVQVLTNKDLSDPSNNLGLPAGTVTLTGTQTLTNKTLTDAVFNRNGKSAATPYSAANLAALPTTGVTDGDLASTADGKLYQRRSGAWAELSPSSGGTGSFNAVTASGANWNSRNFEACDFGNGLVTLRGSAVPATSVDTTGISWDLYGDWLITFTGLSAGLRPPHPIVVPFIISDGADDYAGLGTMQGNVFLPNQLLGLNTVDSGCTFRINLTYSK